MRIKNTIKNLYDDLPNGYQESIEKGLNAVRVLGRNLSYGKGTLDERILRLKNEIPNAPTMAPV